MQNFDVISPQHHSLLINANSIAVSQSSIPGLIAATLYLTGAMLFFSFVFFLILNMVFKNDEITIRQAVIICSRRFYIALTIVILATASTFYTQYIYAIIVFSLGIMYVHYLYFHQIQSKPKKHALLHASLYEPAKILISLIGTIILGLLPPMLLIITLEHYSIIQIGAKGFEALIAVTFLPLSFAVMFLTLYSLYKILKNKGKINAPLKIKHLIILWALTSFTFSRPIWYEQLTTPHYDAPAELKRSTFSIN